MSDVRASVFGFSTFGLRLSIFIPRTPKVRANLRPKVKPKVTFGRALVIVSNALALLFFNLVSLAGGKKWESRVWRPGLKAWVQKFWHEGLGQGLVPGTNGMVLEAWSWRPGARGLGLEN